MNNTSILIIGASGFVGQYLYNQLNNIKSIDLYGTYHNLKLAGLIRFNYKKKESFKIISKIIPDIIIWAAGEKNLKKTELSLSSTLDDNLYPFITLIDSEYISKRTKIIFISSDYVFDGSKGGYTILDKTNPKSFYGKSKDMSEKYLIDNHKNYNIIRAGGIIGDGSAFLKWLIKSFREDNSIELFDNIFSPTPIINIFNCIADILNNIIDDKIIHITGNSDISRYEFGLLVSEILNSKISLIKKNYLESELKLYKDLSLKSSFFSKKNIELDDYINILLK